MPTVESLSSPLAADLRNGHLGHGNDVLHLGGTVPLTFSSSLSINLDKGDDLLRAENVNVGGRTRIVGGPGDDIVDIDDAGFPNGLVVKP